MNFVVEQQQHQHEQEDPYSNFRDSLRSEQTKYKYAYHLKRYMEFLNVKDFNEWLQKCDSLSGRKLDFNPKDKINNDLKHVGSYFPPGFKKIKTDTAYSELYQLLKESKVLS